MSPRLAEYLPAHGAPSSGWRFCVAFSEVSSEAVGCQKARSGLSPVATLVCTPCSYGSGMVTTLTLAPVAFWKPSTTDCGVLLEFWAAQTVSVTPSSFVDWDGQSTGPEAAPGAAGLLHPVRSAALTAATAMAPFHACFMTV